MLKRVVEEMSGNGLIGFLEVAQPPSKTSTASERMILMDFLLIAGTSLFEYQSKRRVARIFRKKNFMVTFP